MKAAEHRRYRWRMVDYSRDVGTDWTALTVEIKQPLSGVYPWGNVQLARPTELTLARECLVGRRSVWSLAARNGRAPAEWSLCDYCVSTFTLSLSLSLAGY